MKHCVKILTLITMYFLSSSPSFCQNWEWQNPLPFGDETELVQFVDSNHGWMTTKTSMLLRTTDGGKNWEQLKLDIFIDAMSFVSPQEGWIVARKKYNIVNRGVYHTTDGGSTWEQQLPDTLMSYTITFLDSLNGWTAKWDNGNVLIQTQDGGKTWENRAREVLYPPHGGIGDITFVDSLRGWAVGDLFFGIRTTDGGKTWERDSSLAKMDKIVFIDSLHGWAISNYWLLNRTVDGGETWESVDVVDQDIGNSDLQLRDIVALDKDRVFVVSDNGIYLSADGGQTWHFCSEQELTSIDFIDSTEAWGAGRGQFHSTDRGQTWENIVQNIVPLGFSNFNTVDFVSLDVGWVGGTLWDSGTYSLLFQTTDGGISWTEQHPGVSGGVTDLFFVDEQNGWSIVGGKIIHTDDGGNTWQQQPTGFDFEYGHHDIAFIDALNGWVVGKYVFRTRDGGNTWTDQTPDSILEIEEAAFVDTTTGWIVGRRSQPYGLAILLKTTNGGQSWNCQFQQSDFEFDSITAVDTNCVWALGDGGVIRSCDSGRTWSQKSVPGAYDKIKFVNPNNGWILGSAEVMFHTDDGGETWVEQKTYTSNRLRDMDFVDEKTGWVVGRNATILHTSTEGNTSVKETTEARSGKPEEFVLYPNYPNPFNARTVISYALSKRERVKLIIYDMIGKEVITLVDEVQPAGFHRVSWDGRDSRGGDVPSGIYLSVLRGESAVQTRKLVLVR